MEDHAILVTVVDEPGMMSRLTTVLAEHEADITHVDIHIGGSTSSIYFEIRVPDGRMSEVLTSLDAIQGVDEVRETPSSGRIYGKRIIIIGGRGTPILIIICG